MFAASQNLLAGHYLPSGDANRTALKKAGMQLYDVALPNLEQMRYDEHLILLHEFKLGIERYLANASAKTEIRSL